MFQLLPPETFRTLLNAGRIERYEHRTLLVRQGQRQEYLVTKYPEALVR